MKIQCRNFLLFYLVWKVAQAGVTCVPMIILITLQTKGSSKKEVITQEDCQYKICTYMWALSAPDYEFISGGQGNETCAKYAFPKWKINLREDFSGENLHKPMWLSINQN